MDIIFSSKNYPINQYGWKYSDFKSAQVWVRNSDRPIKVAIKNVEPNDRAAWQAATSDDYLVDCRLYETTIGEDEDFSSAVENLKYFFIRADRAYAFQESPKTQYGLLVNVTVKHQFRLRTWLAMMAGEGSRYNLLYSTVHPNTANNERYCYAIEPPEYAEEEDRGSVGRLMPLLRVMKFDKPNCSADVALSTLCCATANLGESSPKLKLSEEDIIEFCTQEHNTWDIRWWDNMQNLCKSFLIRISQNIVGTKEIPLSHENKTILREKLCKYILASRQHMTFFSELCWFFNLQYLMENKQLININKELDMVKLQQSCLDAITYTDGVLQLLENSCQHSQSKCAYLGLRIHNVSREGTDRQLFKTIANRKELIERYEKLSGTDWRLDMSAKYYMEISVTDDSYISKTKRKGILETYRENAQQRYPAENIVLPESLQEIFTDKAMPMSLDADGIVHHYGIPSLIQIICRNHGAFLVSSPYKNISEIVTITQNGVKSTTREELCSRQEKELPEIDETTEYHILFPLGITDSKSTPNESRKWHNLFELDNLQDIETNNVATKIYTFKEDLATMNTDKLFLEQDEKIRLVNTAIESFCSAQQGVPHIDNCIQLFDLREINGLHMELFSKFLFRIILDGKNNRRLYAIYFDDFLKQQEFIRLFAIFYKRIERKNTDGRILLDAQIALCSFQQDLGVPEVNLILNMKNWCSLLESARRFAYCNLESSQKVYTQIKYLERDNIDYSTGLPVFPFDLYLYAPMKEIEDNIPKRTSPEDRNCWFLRRISSLLNKDLQQKTMGIKIEDAHTYLPSNVHLSSFYEAELLFHNAEYVSRFAYLIARRLLRDGYTGNKYLVICYEAYSALLGQYLADYLRAAIGYNVLVEYAIMYQEKKGHPQLVMPPSLSDTTTSKNFYKDCKFICLCPIGTTLSTIHTMHECFVHNTQIPIDASNMRDLVLVLVTEPKEGARVQDRYWYAQDVLSNDARGCPSVQQKDRVRLFGRYNESEWNVDYFLEAQSTWHDPEDCPDYEDERALVHADSTSTALNMIFPIKAFLDPPSEEASNWSKFHQRDVCSFLKYGDKRNWKLLKLLKGCLYYGHLRKGSNHYGFFIDIPNYYDKIKGVGTSQDNIYLEWLQKIRNSIIPKDAFNIIVSPLRNGRSSLLKDLVESVFEHSIHILQLDIHNARRTDVLAKYSYITRECKNLLQNDANANINIYYVDDSIVSAETLHRGRSIVQMLLEGCIPQAENAFLYTGVFVLVNRSSKDTVRTFVKNPDRDFHAFVHLAVPHYNTRRDYCPACEQVEKYQQLILRSTTNRFAAEYQRLAEKHKLRTDEEYKLWQSEQLFYSPGAFIRLRQWVYNNSPHFTDESHDVIKAKKILDVLKEGFYQKFYKVHCRNNETNGIYDSHLLSQLLTSDEVSQQVFLRELNQQSLIDQLSTLDENASYSKLFETVWHNYVLQDKAYIRLMATHRAYWMIPLEIEPVVERNGAIVPDRDYMHGQILKYLTPDSECKTDIDRWEYILSSIKVVSRDYLARHHLLRETVFDILRNLADALQGKVIADQDVLDLLRMEAGKRRKAIPALDRLEPSSIDPLLRYQMLLSVLKRLSDMESNYAIHALSSGVFLNKLDQLIKVFFTNTGDIKKNMDRWYYNTLPDRNRMLFDFGKCVKLSTMSEDEENKSMHIQTAHRQFSSNWANGAKEQI